LGRSLGPSGGSVIWALLGRRALLGYLGGLMLSKATKFKWWAVETHWRRCRVRRPFKGDVRIVKHRFI